MNASHLKGETSPPGTRFRAPPPPWLPHTSSTTRARASARRLLLAPGAADARPGPTQLLIDGKWVNSLSGKTFETINPATGEVIAKVQEADKADVDVAVKAARRAFQTWRNVNPAERCRLLLKLADLIEQHKEELAQIESAGASLRASPCRSARALIPRLEFSRALRRQRQADQPRAHRPQPRPRVHPLLCRLGRQAERQDHPRQR